ncbi:BLUF domain-containing protein [Nitrobacter winogradskyi]|uniref:BLUF domain-containing protein n=1 Tax=Nitrobacter winogradskyi TaxID=913 RepID=UPI0024BF353F|nr:BLUF domain-containing protein [Nitrobacter winogradskyi]
MASILPASRKNNSEVGVTAALMFNPGCFAQLLEGPQDAVEGVFERIQQDERHGDVSLLAFEPVEKRAIENWSMGFVGAPVADAARYGTMAEESGFDSARMIADALFATLHRLAVEEEGRSF